MPQKSLALIFSGLLAGAVFQLAGPSGLPAWSTGLVGGVAAGAVLRLYQRSRRHPLEAPEPLPSLTRSQALWLLGAVLVIAFALRAYHLTDRPAWEDEMWTLRNIYTANYLELLRVAADDYWPPLHYLILNTLVRFTDTGLFWLRFPSVVFGVITVGLVYWVGARFFHNRFVGLVAAALLTGATTHVLYSQEARVYSLLMMLAVLSAYFFLESHQQRRISPAYVVVTTLLVYSHSFVSWYFIASQSVFVLVAFFVWRDGQAFLKGFLSQLLVLVLWLPLVGAFLYSRAVREIEVPTQWATGANDQPGILSLVELYQGLAVRSWVGAAFTAVLLVLATLPLFTRARPERPDTGETAGRGPGWEGPEYVPAILFLCCWLTVPVLFSLGVTVFSDLDTFGEVRYHLPVLPAIALTAAGAFLFLGSRSLVVAAALVVLLLPPAELPRYYRDFDRPAMDQAAEIVRANEVGTEAIYVDNSFRVFQYYYRGFFPRIGSVQWDSLTAAHADQVDRFTIFDSNKWGDTYAFERLNERIHFLGNKADGIPGQIREEAERGGLREPFWMVVQDNEGGLRRLHELEEAALPCNRREYQVPGAVVWHCRGTSGDRPSSTTPNR